MKIDKTQKRTTKAPGFRKCLYCGLWVHYHFCSAPTVDPLEGICQSCGRENKRKWAEEQRRLRDEGNA